jgi:hypothetical protein
LSDSLFNLDEIEPLPIFAPIAAHIRGLRARVAELEAQNRHDDEADTECRNLIMSENDDLRARVAELEALLDRCRYTVKLPFRLLEDIESALNPKQ